MCCVYKKKLNYRFGNKDVNLYIFISYSRNVQGPMNNYFFCQKLVPTTHLSTEFVNFCVASIFAILKIPTS